MGLVSPAPSRQIPCLPVAAAGTPVVRPPHRCAGSWTNFVPAFGNQMLGSGHYGVNMGEIHPSYAPVARRDRRASDRDFKETAMNDVAAPLARHKTTPVKVGDVTV